MNERIKIKYVRERVKYMVFGILTVIRPPDIGDSFILRNPWIKEPTTIIVQTDRTNFNIITSKRGGLYHLRNTENSEQFLENQIFLQMSSFGYPGITGPCPLTFNDKNRSLFESWIKLPMEEKSMVIINYDREFEACYEMTKNGSKNWACNEYTVFLYLSSKPWLVVDMYSSTKDSRVSKAVRITRDFNWEPAEDLIGCSFSDIMIKNKYNDFKVMASANEMGSILDAYVSKINRFKYENPVPKPPAFYVPGRIR